jgi:hypothetical protein
MQVRKKLFNIILLARESTTAYCASFSMSAPPSPMSSPNQSPTIFGATVDAIKTENIDTGSKDEDTETTQIDDVITKLKDTYPESTKAK